MKTALILGATALCFIAGCTMPGGTTPHKMFAGQTQDGLFTFLSNRIAEVGSKRSVSINFWEFPNSRQNIKARAAGLPMTVGKVISVDYDCEKRTVSVTSVEDDFEGRNADMETVDHAAVPINPATDPVDAKVMAFACLPGWRRSLVDTFEHR